MTQLEELVQARELSPLTKRAYLRAVRSFLAFAGGSPDRWTPEAAWRWRQQLEVRVKRGELAPQTVNQQIHGLRTAARLWMQLNRQDPRFDFGVLLQSMPRGEPVQKKRALNYDQGAALLAACGGQQPMDLRDRAMVMLGLHTGMRRTSLSTLELERIDWRQRVMTIRLKGGRLHKMPPLDVGTMEALEPWREYLAAQRIRGGRFFRRFHGAAVGHAERYTVGDSLSVDGVHLSMCTRAQKARLKGFSPHTFRHTFVTWMQELKVPGYVISAYTGHKSDAMVLEYTDAWLSVQRQSPQALLPSAIGGHA